MKQLDTVNAYGTHLTCAMFDNFGVADLIVFRWGNHIEFVLERLV